jgi:hypothetical protein
VHLARRGELYTSCACGCTARVRRSRYCVSIYLPTLELVHRVQHVLRQYLNGFLKNSSLSLAHLVAFDSEVIRDRLPGVVCKACTCKGRSRAGWTGPTGRGCTCDRTAIHHGYTSDSYSYSSLLSGANSSVVINMLNLLAIYTSVAPQSTGR